MSHIWFVMFWPNLALTTSASLGSHLFCLGQKNAYSARSLPEVAHIRMLSGRYALKVCTAHPAELDLPAGEQSLETPSR